MFGEEEEDTQETVHDEPAREEAEAEAQAAAIAAVNLFELDENSNTPYQPDVNYRNSEDMQASIEEEIGVSQPSETQRSPIMPRRVPVKKEILKKSAIQDLKFSEEEEIKFAELVKENPHLYDKSDKLWYNT